jgi:GTPase
LLPVGTTREHLGLALALGVPIFVVISKIDMCRQIQVDRTLKQLERLLKGPGCKKVPFRIHNESDATTAANIFHDERFAMRMKMKFQKLKYCSFLCSICPIFTLSSVSGKNLQLLVKFLNVLPPLLSKQEWEEFANEETEHQVC